MKFFHKRHYTSCLPYKIKPNESNPSPHSQILHYCEPTSLDRAIKLLNSTDSRKLSLKPNIYASLLHTCTKSLTFNLGLQIHSHVTKSGLDYDRFVGNSLLSMYFKLCCDFSETRQVFDNMFVRDVVSWTSMVCGYVRAGKPVESIELFTEMSEFRVEPNGFTLSAVIRACSDLRSLNLGRCFHGMVLRRGFNSNCVILSALVDMYGWCSSLGDARQVFDEISEPDSICWTSIISVFTRNDNFEEALAFFYLMQRKYRISADGFTFGTILTACGNLGRVERGREVHGKVITAGISGNVVVESSLVDMYGKCKLIEDSQWVFDRMPMKNAVSWCALLGGYCQNGNYVAVLELFRGMKKGSDRYSFGTVLRACAGLAAVRQGKEVHCQYMRMGGWRDVIVESALVDLYAKCGCIDYAYIVFSKIPIRNLITWNSMICGFAQNGRGKDALGLFNLMVQEGIEPDYISFIGVLFACSHSGLVEKGRGYFMSMTEYYGIKAGLEHYNCMVDLLGRAGLLEEAEELIEKAAFRDNSSLWAALLGACTAYSNSFVAERVAKKMMELEPDYHLSYVLLANIYKAVGRWDDAMEIRRLMRERRIQKMPGKSWIEINSDISTHTSLLNQDDFTDIGGSTMEVRREDINQILLAEE